MELKNEIIDNCKDVNPFNTEEIVNAISHELLRTSNNPSQATSLIQDFQLINLYRFKIAGSREVREIEWSGHPNMDLVPAKDVEIDSNLYRFYFADAPRHIVTECMVVNNYGVKYIEMIHHVDLIKSMMPIGIGLLSDKVSDNFFMSCSRVINKAVAENFIDDYMQSLLFMELGLDDGDVSDINMEDQLGEYYRQSITFTRRAISCLIGIQTQTPKGS